MNKIVKKDINIILEAPIDWYRFEGKTILVTGANGMLPSYIVLSLLGLNKKKILANPCKVIALVRNMLKASKVFDEVIDDPFLSFCVQDVSKPISISGNIDFIIHAASQASPKYYGTDPVGTLNANILGTHNLLEMAIEKKVEAFLMFSSGGVYGEIGSSKMPMIESDSGYLNCLNVRNCYFESKRMAENMCVSYASQYGVNTKIVRVFHTYGPNMDINDGRAFSDFCKCVINNEDIVLHSDGSAKRTFCYISDAVVGYFLVLLKGKQGEAYNVGNPFEETSIRQLADTIIGLYPEKKLQVRTIINENDITYGKMKSPVKRTVPDISKLLSLGWSPKVSISEGFRYTIDALQQKYKLIIQ